MPRLIFKNNFEVALAQPTTTSDTTITIRSGSGFPTLGANERVVATIVDATTGLQFEIVTVTAVVGNVLTVQRAQEGTAAREWAAGDMLSIRTTAASLTNTVRNYGQIPSGINLDALTGSWFGFYWQNSNAGASTALNYPVAQAGSLEVIQHSAGTLHDGCTQIYRPYSGGNLEYHRQYGTAWSTWKQVFSSANVIPLENGGTGQTTVQGMKTAFGFGQVADQNIVPTSMGGTGSSDNAQAWLNIRPQGSTPLAGDPVNDYDATTKRWVENLVNTGTVGPNMNGVMNYGVGDFHLRDSRAYIQPYEVVSDGQLLNRADWPELWSYAQMLSPIADADWLADPLKRGKYSAGNGTTTFRVPDRNGVQTGSVAGLFGRGDSAVSSNDGTIGMSGSPNITGSIDFVSVGDAFAYVGGSGTNSALQPSGALKNPPRITEGDPGGQRSSNLSIDASKSSPVYGRTATETRPNHFVGVWVIRASGGFVAANTSWSVINGNATRPSDGVTADGGHLKSEYKINGAVEGELSWRIRAAIGNEYYARLNVYNATASRTAVYDFNDLGTFSAKSLRSGGEILSDGNLTLHNQGYPGINFKSNRYNTPATQVGASTIIEVSGTDGSVSVVNLIRRRADGNQAGQIIVTFPTTGGTIALQGTSGLEYKRDIADADAKEAMERINSQRLVNFVYKDDEQERVRFGIIAEEAEVIAPQYIKHNDEPYEDIFDEEGNKIGEKVRDRPSVDTNPIVMDLMGCVQYLNKQIEDLKAEIVALKAAK